MGRVRKAWVAAAVEVGAWLAGLAGVDVPVEVRASLVVLLVWGVPNDA